MAELCVGVAITVTVTVRHLVHTALSTLHGPLVVHSLVVALGLHQVNRDIHSDDFRCLCGLLSEFFRTVFIVIFPRILLVGLNSTELDDWQLVRLGYSLVIRTGNKYFGFGR